MQRQIGATRADARFQRRALRAVAAGAISCVVALSSVADSAEGTTLALAATCGAGKSRAGMQYANPAVKFDAIRARITPLGGYGGLAGSERVVGFIGLGYSEPTRSYVGAGVGGYRGDKRSRFQFEWWGAGLSHFVPAWEFGFLRNEVAYTVAIVRVRDEQWAITLNGRRARQGTLTLSESAQGLPLPRAYLTSSNETLPCNNRGSFRFQLVTVRRHGSSRWEPLPPDTSMGADPGHTIRLISRTSFVAGTGR